MGFPYSLDSVIGLATLCSGLSFMIYLVFFISVNDCSAFTQSKNFQIFNFEHPNIELEVKPRCRPSAIFVERGKRLRLCTDYRTIIISNCFIVMTKKESIEVSVLGARAFQKNFHEEANYRN